MPTIVGAWAPNGSVNNRMQLILMYDTESTATQVKVTGSVIVAVGAGFSDSNNQFGWAGSFFSTSGSTSKSITVPTNGSATIHTFSATFNRTASAQGKTLAFSLGGIESVNGVASVSTVVTIPALTSRPAAPGSVLLATNSNGGSTLSWTGGTAHRIEVSRRATRGNNTSAWQPWELIGESSGYASGTGFSLAAGYQWKARVRRTNGSLVSDWGYSNVANAFTVPAAIASLTATWYSDVRTALAIGATTETNSTPLVSLEIQRWSQTKQEYVSAANGLSKSTKNWDDRSSLFNNRARWRICGVNAAGRGPWVYSGYVSGTPSAPTNAKGARRGASDIDFSCTNTARVATTIDILGQSSSDGNLWTPLTNIVTGLTAPAEGATLKRTLTGLDTTKKWRFVPRVRVATPSGRYADGSRSNIVQLLAPPARPTIVGPVTTQVADSSVTLSWRHNPVDESEQTAATVKYTLPGSSTEQTIQITGAAQSTVLNNVPSGEVRWTVATKGAHSTYSPTSAVGVFDVAVPPSGAITSPLDGDTIATNRLALEFEFFDAQGAALASWTRRLYDSADNLIENVSGSGSNALRVITFDTKLIDLSTYRAEIVLRSGTGLSSEPISVTVHTAFHAPIAPILTGTWYRNEGIAKLDVLNSVGAVYAWTGLPYQSPSTKTLADGTQETNLFWDPFGQDPGWYTYERGNAGESSYYLDRPALKITSDGSTGTIFQSGAMTGIVAGSWIAARFTIAAANAAAVGAKIGATVVVAGFGAVATNNGIEPTVGQLGTETVVHAPSYVKVPAPAPSLRLMVSFIDTAPPAGAEFFITDMQLEYVDDQAMTVQSAAAFSGETKSSDDTATNRLERSYDAGLTWEILGEDLGLNPHFEDSTVKLNTEVLWRTIAISPLGVEAASQALSLTTAATAAFTTTIDGETIALPYNLELPAEYELDAEFVHTLGRRKRIALWPLDRDPDMSVALTGVTLSYKEETTWRKVLGAPTFFRDPTGRAFWAAATALTWTPRSYGWADVSLTFTEIDHE